MFYEVIDSKSIFIMQIYHKIDVTNLNVLPLVIDTVVFKHRKEAMQSAPQRLMCLGVGNERLTGLNMS